MAVTDGSAERAQENHEYPMVELCAHLCNGKLEAIIAWDIVKYLAKT